MTHIIVLLNSIALKDLGDGWSYEINVNQEGTELQRFHCWSGLHTVKAKGWNWLHKVTPSVIHRMKLVYNLSLVHDKYRSWGCIFGNFYTVWQEFHSLNLIFLNGLIFLYVFVFSYCSFLNLFVVDNFTKLPVWDIGKMIFTTKSWKNTEMGNLGNPISRGTEICGFHIYLLKASV